MVSLGRSGAGAFHFAKGVRGQTLLFRRLHPQSDSGLSYWPNTEPDLAVTAYAVNFLADVSAVLPDAGENLKSLVAWLESQQQPDGTWRPAGASPDAPQTLMLTSTALRALAAARHAGVEVKPSALAGAYSHIARFTDSIDEPYMLAQFILAALDSGDEALLRDAPSRLAGLVRDERGGLYWDLKSNTPFYGWGDAGRSETTGLAVSALAAWRAAHPNASELDKVIRGGLLFLFRTRGRDGGWYSTQSTVRAMRAVADAGRVFGNFGHGEGSVAVRSNGRLLQTVALPGSQSLDPISIDLSNYLATGDNHIEMEPSGDLAVAIASLVSSYGRPWDKKELRTSPELALAVTFSRLNARAGQSIRCHIQAERIGFRGYGMMLAEIGLPPAAEIDRSSLEAAAKAGKGFNHYEIQPDRVVLYLWPKAGGVEIDFDLRIRTPIDAKSLPSVLYDYYNPDALTEIEPFRWRIKADGPSFR